MYLKAFVRNHDHCCNQNRFLVILDDMDGLVCSRFQVTIQSAMQMFVLIIPNYFTKIWKRCKGNFTSLFTSVSKYKFQDYLCKLWRNTIDSLALFVKHSKLRVSIFVRYFST